MNALNVSHLPLKCVLQRRERDYGDKISTLESSSGNSDIGSDDGSEVVIHSLRMSLESTMGALKAQEAAAEGNARERERCLRRVKSATEARVRAECDARFQALLDARVKVAAEAARKECLEGECAELLAAQAEQDAAKFEEERRCALLEAKGAQRHTAALAAAEASAEAVKALETARMGEVDAHAAAMGRARKEAAEEAKSVAEAVKVQVLAEQRAAHEILLKEEQMRAEANTKFLEEKLAHEHASALATAKEAGEASRTDALAKQEALFQVATKELRASLEIEHALSLEEACALAGLEATQVAEKQAEQQLKAELTEAEAKHSAVTEQALTQSQREHQAFLLEVEHKHSVAQSELTKQHQQEVADLYQSRAELTASFRLEVGEKTEQLRSAKEELATTKAKLESAALSASAAAKAHEKAVVLSAELSRTTQDALQAELVIVKERMEALEKQWRLRHDTEVCFRTLSDDDDDDDDGAFED